MPIVRKLHVGGALFKIVTEPQFDARLTRYVAEVAHDDGRVQKVYSRLPAGPFVFHVPSTDGAHP